MQIEIFTICDAAQVYAGKAVVTGAFNQLTVAKLPVTLQTMTLAVRVAFEKQESGNKTFYFSINNPDGTPLVHELRCETRQLIEAGKALSPLTTYDMNIVFGNLNLNQFGGYTVIMRFEGKKYEHKFYVVEGNPRIV